MEPSVARQVWAVMVRDWQIELRQRYALNGLLLYVVATGVVTALGLRAGRAPDDPAVWAVLFWVLQLFAALTAVGKSFVAERESQQLFLYPWVSPTALITARLVYNGLVVLGLTLVAFVLFGALLGWPGPPLRLLPLLALGALGLSSVFSLTSALAARARNPTTLLAVLSLPLAVPQLLTLIRGTLGWALTGEVAANTLLSLAALAALPAVLALLLFPFLWRDA